jgi:diguanylate cyclase (GGDEF)-like protein
MRRWTVPPAAIVLAVVTMTVCAVILSTSVADTQFGVYFDDLGEFAVAAVAAGCAAWRARKSADRALRRSWWILAAACGSWAVGQAFWSWFELGTNNSPFPSVADIGFLCFPLLAGAALLLHPAAGAQIAGSRRILDALMATAALALLSWETVFHAVMRNPTDSLLTFAVSLAYPITDFIVLLLVLLTLTRARGNRLSLSLVAAGCTALAVSDSLFAYLMATNGYNGGAVDLGWMAAFVLIALAAVATDRPAGPTHAGASATQATATQATATQATATQATWSSAFMPYVPVVASLAVMFACAFAGRPPTAPQLALLGVVVGLLLSRQYLTLRRNSLLTAELERREAQLLHQAFHDNLTGLANRALFQDRLAHALELHGRDLRALSVIFLDLDDFKLINDTLGHSVGDQLLCRAAERIVGALRSGDTVARLGGDEFAVLVEDGGDCVATASKLVAALRAPFVIEGQRLEIRASAGVAALLPEDPETDAAQLLIKADTAMYAAKRAGKGRVALYHDGMALTELSDGALAIALAAAVSAGQITLAYQPIMDLTDGSMTGLEALARWRYQGEEIPPGTFIPLAERAGIIPDLTRHVLRVACAQLAEWSHRFGRGLSVAVNVPPSQIVSPDFARLVSQLVAEHQLRPGQLVIEITESGAFEDLSEAQSAINALRACGVGISLDDFGVGNSSFARLHHVDFDSVKIDKAFIETLEDNPRQAQFLGALLRLSKDLGVQVIVEGVERSEQLATLLELGQPMAQGYLFARPLAPSACEQFLAQRFGACATQRTRLPIPRTALSPVPAPADELAS